MKNRCFIMKIAEKNSRVSREFIKNTADFSFKLFQKTVKQEENIMISPVSVLLAMIMTANGAGTETCQEIERVVGGGSIQELNVQMNHFLAGLYTGEKAVLKRADSIWFKNTERDFAVNKDFLRLVCDEFHAKIFPAPFDNQTKQQINSWVFENTEGRIENFLKVLPETVLMYLIDIWTLDAEWARIYEKHEISEGIFTAYNNRKQKASMMYGTEISYLEDEAARGFVKPYAQGYSFVALLPKKGGDIKDYIRFLSGERFLSLLNHIKHTMIVTKIPKFQGSSSLELGEMLKDMGIKKVFSEEADLSRMGKSGKEALYIGRVFQNSYIQVDERGTKAGAATAVELARSAVMGDKIELNRPFIYAVVDNATKLPLFLGTVLSM